MSVKSSSPKFAEETRDTLIQEALELFARHGYAGTSIDRIAEKVSMTKGAVYYYFSSKKEVLIACYQLQAQWVAEAVGAVPETDNPWDDTLRLCDTFLDFVVSNGRHTMPLQEVITFLGWETWRDIDSRYTMGTLARTISRLQDGGWLKPYPRNLLISMIYGVLVEAAINLASSPDDYTLQDMKTLIADFLGGMRA
ncbi:TetR/AcrR family transcriptional regulator [Alcanivorax sp.]|uniref:TetR/AcrR family transcriptional regulator n=1 Tax=Alcanivorax sp. TaxID=1872427 RepID=UPI002B2737A1|nr:TetR/AcrR family transcriptional regulator [Alcanivorax sp.]